MKRIKVINCRLVTRYQKLQRKLKVQKKMYEQSQQAFAEALENIKELQSDIKQKENTIIELKKKKWYQFIEVK